MGKVIIQEYTIKNPLNMIGEEAGICWGAPTSITEKNIRRAWDCITSGHGRTMEFPEVYMILDGYSARVIREFYTHIAGSPTRLQASTRYIDYAKDGFDYVTPPSIVKNYLANRAYEEMMEEINKYLRHLEELGIPKEDVANGLPLGMTTKVVVRMNLRTLVEMSHQRLCTRAYWEFRQLMKDIMQALSKYSEEWAEVIKALFISKCDYFGFCNEARSCGKAPSREELQQIFDGYFK